MTHLAPPVSDAARDARYQAPLDGRIMTHDLDQGMVCERVTFGEGLAVCRASGACARDTTFAAPDDAGPRLHLQVITRGRCVFTERSRERPLPERRVAVIQADGQDAAWTITSTEPVSVLSIDISERRLNDWLGDAKGGGWRDRLANAATLGDVSYGNLVELMHLLQRKSVGRLALEARVLNAVWQSLRPFEADDRSGPAVDDLANRLDQVRALIERGGQQARSMSALSELSGMGVRQLNRAYREAFGVTLFQALLNARLDRAFAELRQGDRPIKRVAWQAGYEHPTSFTHAFRRRFGIAPNAVRPR